MAALLAREQGVSVAPSTVHRFLDRHRITLDEAPEMYKIWRDKKENVTKIVIDPWTDKKVA